jgi:group II intron reverse transcriptase/maturase
MPSALERIGEVARRDKKVRFTTLMHHVYDLDTLRGAYFCLKRDAAPGVDGQTWREYGEQLEEKIKDLSERLKRGAYRAKPVRRVLIPKPDGGVRPLGVTTLEDKIVQRATVEVLNQIYEADFLGFSYGFRPGRGAHDALDALYVGITERRVNWVLDLDIREFFTSINHEWLVKFVEHRIADRRIVRLIQKWLRAGVLEDGQRIQSEVGTPQGGGISPLLANIYLHYVLDLWAQAWRRQARGDVIIVRYADDGAVGFQHESEARRFWADLAERFAKFGLELHPPRKDPSPRIRPPGGRGAEAERTGQARELRLPRLHARLREDPEGAVRGAAADVSQATAAETQGGQNRTEEPHACTRPGGRQVAGNGAPGALQLLRGAPEQCRPQLLPLLRLLALVAHSAEA